MTLSRHTHADAGAISGFVALLDEAIRASRQGSRSAERTARAVSTPCCAEGAEWRWRGRARRPDRRAERPAWLAVIVGRRCSIVRCGPSTRQKRNHDEPTHRTRPGHRGSDSPEARGTRTASDRHRTRSSCSELRRTTAVQAWGRRARHTRQGPETGQAIASGSLTESSHARRPCPDSLSPLEILNPEMERHMRLGRCAGVLRVLPKRFLGEWSARCRNIRIDASHQHYRENYAAHRPNVIPQRTVHNPQPTAAGEA